MTTRIEVLVPGATSRDLRVWANNIAEANPITSEPTSFTPTVNLDVTDYPFMGVELAIQSERQQLLVIALFAQIPNEKEKEVMQENDVAPGGE